jgi:hypothetical protein
MERRHDGCVRHGQGGDARDRGHRLVQVEDIEALALEQPLDPHDGGRAEDDVGKRAVRRDDHRAPDRDHIRRRAVVPAAARVQQAREGARRVAAADDPHVVPEVAKGLGLAFGVLDDSAPKGPGERDDDPDFHLGPDPIRGRIVSGAPE